MKISELGEFGLIDEIHTKNPIKDKKVVAGIGDDAAIIKVPAGKKNFLLTTDTLVEGVHFSLKYFTFFELGWKLMAVNLSDIAAMGGVPKYALVTLGLNKKLEVWDIDEFYRGMKTLGKKYKVEIVGGDIVTSPRDLFFTMDIFGVADKAVKRSGARAGNVIVSIGEFGRSALGLCELKKTGRKGRNVKAHLMPVPMLKEGRLASRFATSMIDNSDGLARCVIEICKASKVGARVYLDRVPLADGASLKQGLYGGEDYNLVLTVPKNRSRSIKGGRVIGEITKGRKLFLVDRAGAKKELEEKGYEHF